MMKPAAIVKQLLEGEDDYLIPKMQGQVVRQKLREYIWHMRGRTLGWGVTPDGNMEISVGVPDGKDLARVKEFLQSLGLKVLRARRWKNPYEHPTTGTRYESARFWIDGQDILHDETWKDLAANPIRDGADTELWYGEDL
jgi:hypothetical protein